MLTRQLASAGSGKTYTLAKQFIWLYITIDNNGRRRLRTREELTDSLRHILAITFTNKATGEMKQRIISKLAALSNYHPVLPSDGKALNAEEKELEKKRIKETDYLEEFSDMLNVEPAEITRVAKEALDVLLNEFSDFQVSTIDSFFQLVMRTFTYEAELPDNFQLEMDSKYVAGLGLDTALMDLNSSRASEEFRFWAKKMVEEGINDSGNWNLFSPGRKTLYNKVLSMIITMESESFKESMQKLREYFAAHEGTGDVKKGGFIGELTDHYDNKYNMPLRRDAARVRRAATEALAYISRNDIDTRSLAAYLHGRLLKLSNLNWKKGPDGKFTGENFMLKSAMKKGVPNDPELLDIVHSVGETLEAYLGHFNDRNTRSWLIYSKALRQLALIREIKKKIDSLMIDNNTLQLSDTNSILRTIIGDDETPFIYERLGSRLNHFLIDEFQDTSRLQWENTLPLLRESESRGQENLIIGDPKQSIYRFRNADSSLITTAVLKEFPDLNDAGNDPKTNTNWRSDLNIVRFNNFLFHSLSRAGLDYTSSYGDVIQFSNKYKPGVATDGKGESNAEGYVNIRFFKSTDDSDGRAPVDTGDEDTDYPEFFSEIGYLINELRGRGYRQKDIAVLVSTHKIGSQVIDALLDFNSRINRKDENAPEAIRFVSEDSLKVANAQGVRTVIEALEAINGDYPFTRPAVRLTEDGSENELSKEPLAEFSSYASKTKSYISEPLARMLEKMAVTTLPALVEELIATFVPIPVRMTEAPFLAALQDTVLEFTENHVADIPTFLKWWDKHGDSLTISSPESTDAVQIVTVHSAKGLEFGAVIIPDANYSFSASPHKVETAWLKPALPADTDYPLPPVLPLELTKALENTYHESDLASYRKNVATDKLNAAYVAFTRAKHELHILAGLSMQNWPADPNGEDDSEEKKKKSKSKKTSDDLEEEKIPAVPNLAKGLIMTLLEPDKWLDTVPSDKTPYVIVKDDLHYSFSKRILPDLSLALDTLEISYGSPVFLGKTETESKSDKESETGKTTREIRIYNVNDHFPALHFRRESDLIDTNDDLIETVNITEENESESESRSFSAEKKEGENTGETVEYTEETVEIVEEEKVDEEEIKPLSETALLREILGRLAITGNLDKAILPLKVSGKWGDEVLSSFRNLIEGFLKSENGKQFLFPPEGWRILANRPLIHRRRKTRIPDRIHISPDGAHAMVINFKPYELPDGDDMIRLRAHVRALRKTGFKGRIEGWICHLQTASVFPLTFLKDHNFSANAPVYKK